MMVFSIEYGKGNKNCTYKKKNCEYLFAPPLPASLIIVEEKGQLIVFQLPSYRIPESNW